MRETMLSLVVILALASRVSCSDAEEDYVRGKSDETQPADSIGPERMLYFYRTPIHLHPVLAPALKLEYRKRFGNDFKNHMLSKPMDDDRDERTNKRSSKIALSQMMGNRHEPYENNSPKVIYDIPLSEE